MKTLGNVLWFIFGGFFWAISFFLIGVVMFLTIIGIPVGIQFFQLAKFVLWPFGKKVVPAKPAGYKTVLNVIWAILGGWETALGLLLTGVLLCITIIGIPFGRQYFKMAHFALLPLGHTFGD